MARTATATIIAAIGVTCAGLWLSSTASASGRPSAPNAKRELTAEIAWARWKTIAVPALSNDGRWVAYNIVSMNGEAEVVLRATRGSVEFRFSRGRGDEARGNLREYSVMAEERPTEFTPDSRHLIFTVTPSDTQIAEIAGEAIPASPHSQDLALGIVELPTGNVTYIADATAFWAPKSGGEFIAYTMVSRAPVATGKTVVLRSLKTSRETRIEGVADFAFAPNGAYFAYTVSSANELRAGAYVRRLSDGHTSPILQGPGTYPKLALDPQGRQVAVLSDRDTRLPTKQRYSIYLAPSPWSIAHAVVEPTDLPSDMEIAGLGDLEFTKGAQKLVFSLKPSSSEARRDAPAQFELYHWKRPFPQDSARSQDLQKGYAAPKYAAVYDIPTRRFIQLGTASIPIVQLSSDGRHAIGIDATPYELQSGAWGDDTVDIYVVNTASGHATLFRKGFRFGSSLSASLAISPGGRYLTYFEDRRWYCYDLQSEHLVDLTGPLLPAMHFEWDRQSYPESRKPMAIGIAGWTAEDQDILVYDQNGIWKLDPEGQRPAQDLINGVSQRTKWVFRLWPHDYNSFIGVNDDSKDIDLARPMLLTGFDLESNSMGIWRLPCCERAALQPVLVEHANITLYAARDSPEQYLATRETFEEFPDILVGRQLSKLQKISGVNPQQQEFRWGRVEQVAFTSAFGVPLKGLLYTPEDFDRAKRYPMIVEIYGQQSLLRYSYAVPSPSEVFPTAIYLSKGYVVFMPDVSSAPYYQRAAVVAAVTRGVESILDRGFVDPERVCLTGFSQGGINTNFIITQTRMFRCAIAGAGLSDMVSGYADSPATHERGAWLLGATPWERPEVYLANSAVLFADRVQTPLLMLSNEKDSLTPLSQAIEYFTALRRVGQEVYLLNYHGEGHGLSTFANRLDWTRRRAEFLDYFLKDAPKPAWMEYGLFSSASGAEPVSPAHGDTSLQ